MKARILLIEDEPGLVLTIRDRLRSEGAEVVAAMTGEEGERRALESAFDLILLDVMLPDRDGFEVCRNLRGRGSRTPILMLTARGSVDDRVLGLRMGADDYLPKPFDLRELLARIQALLRRAAPASVAGGRLALSGGIEVDLEMGEVTRPEGPVTLSGRERDLLLYMAAHPREVLTRDRLLLEVWGYPTAPPTRTVDVHIAGLRRKVEARPDRPAHILTVHGEGYRFLPTSA